MNELKLIQTTRIERDYIEKLPAAIATLAEPFLGVVAAKGKMRIVIDYDPSDRKVEFNYYELPESRSLESL